MAQGSHAAFTELFQLYNKKIYQTAYLFAQSEELAEEIVQDVFLTIWLRRSHFAKVQDLESYLFITTRNAVTRMLKIMGFQEKRVKEWSDGQSNLRTPDQLEWLLEKEYDQLLLQAVNRLPAQQQEVYRLIKIKGLSRKEAALQLNLQEETVKRHLSLALRSIRAHCLQHMGLLPWVISLLFRGLL